MIQQTPVTPRSRFVSLLSCLEPNFGFVHDLNVLTRVLQHCVLMFNIYPYASLAVGAETNNTTTKTINGCVFHLAHSTVSSILADCTHCNNARIITKTIKRRSFHQFLGSILCVSVVRKRQKTGSEFECYVHARHVLRPRRRPLCGGRHLLPLRPGLLPLLHLLLHIESRRHRPRAPWSSFHHSHSLAHGSLSLVLGSLSLAHGYLSLAHGSLSLAHGSAVHAAPCQTCKGAKKAFSHVMGLPAVVWGSWEVT
jgi:hypothetical protein